MQRSFIIILLILAITAGCKKDEVPLSGTITIDNNLYGTSSYYSLGFSFEKADLVSTLSSGFDIVLTNDGTIANLILQASNFNNSFYLAGTYSDESAAKQAFTAMIQPVVNGWAEWAFGVKPNQIWIYRTSKDTYAKMRIISTESVAKTPRNYAACTFEWVYQPDGTLTFGGK